MSYKDLWLLLAGLGLFLFGMDQVESAIKQLGGRTFKLFLKKHTDSKFRALLSGTIITGILQSSSLVTLMVLNLVGAGIISMRNALAVVFGSNLGTTLDSWIVAVVGFKFNIESLAFPVIAISAIGGILLSTQKKLKEISGLGLGIGLLFLGLGYMKESVEGLVTQVDLRHYSFLGNIGFVIAGFIITAIIQSSSATMVIALSALNSGAITLETATAVIIGSELGTSIKILLGSIGGISAKRRVALGNIIFNTFIVICAYILMHPMIRIAQWIAGTNQPLMSLVLFQSMINLMGIITFFPFLNKLGDYLDNKFKKEEIEITQFIQDTNPLLPEVFIDALEKETFLFIREAVYLSAETFDIELKTPIPAHIVNPYYKRKINDNSIKKYEDLKRYEGAILSICARVSEEKIEKTDLLQLNNLTNAIRNAMYAAKGMKDIQHNKEDLHNSSNNVKYGQYHQLREQLMLFYRQLLDILNKKDQKKTHSDLKALLHLVTEHHQKQLKNIYQNSRANQVDEVEISTLLNISREIYTSSKALVLSAKDYLLSAESGEQVEPEQVFL